MSLAKKVRIFIVDDHPVVREWVTNLIGQQSDFILCGEGEDANGALHGICSKQPDVAIIDISLKESFGLDLIRSVKQHAPHVAMLVYSMHDEKLYAERCIRAGARGYIMKNEITKKLIDAIHTVMKGSLFISEKMASIFSEKFVGGSLTVNMSPLEVLSNRELEVFDLMGKGQQTRQIAETLNVNIKTVQTYCVRMKQKLKISTAAELMREAIRWHEQQQRV